MKTCKDCKVEKPLSEYYFSKGKTGDKKYYFAYCKECGSKRHRKWREDNREHHLNYVKFWQIAKRYGLNPDDYIEMLSKGCEVCGTTEGLAIDHDHSCCPSYKKTCGKCITGVLCRAHNLAAGYCNDDPEEAQKLADYLARTRKLY